MQKQVTAYAELMERLGLTALEVREGDVSIRLERAPVAAAHKTAPVEAEPAEAPRDDRLTVRSPLVGMFYRSPEENGAPYVQVGDRVTRGQTLCIIEAMKLMNEITAEQDGVIAEICAANGQVVEYGAALFRMERP